MKTIRFERNGSIGTIVLANPPLNRIDMAYAANLREAVHEASESDVRVLVVRAEGPNFSLGGEVREWPGRNRNWFRTFVAEVNASYRAIEALRIPTIAAVQGAVFGGGFELALSCDMVIASEDTVFRCVEVTTAMLPIAGAVQRLAEHVGRSRAARIVMLGEPISAAAARDLGFVTEVVSGSSLATATASLAGTLATGPTRAYAAIRTLLKVWSSGGVAATDAAMMDVITDLFDTDDVRRGFLSTAEAFDAEVEPPAMKFAGC